LHELHKQKWRLYALFAITVGCFAVLASRLVYIQIVQHDHFYAMAQEEHWRSEEIPARRGTIMDSASNPLAISVSFDSLYANTLQIDDPDKLAEVLAPILEVPVLELEQKLSLKQAAPVLLKEHLPAEKADEIRKLRLWDIYLRPEYRREHPQGKLAAQLVGVVGRDGNGLSGLELKWDSDLAGKPGSLLAERDTGGEEIALSAAEYVAPVDGSNLVLTIDRTVQMIVERELDAAMQQHQAAAGTVLVMDPYTGAILAVASRPSFDPEAKDLFSAETVPLYSIPAVADAFEPGSIFKIITMAAALDAGAVTPETAFMNNGSFSYAGGVVRNAVWRAPGMETMTQTLQRSSNIGAAFAATTLGPERFYSYVQAFGIGAPTGIELPGESPGILRLPSSPDWHPFDLATNSFGQGVSVTPIQMVTAVSAVANGGLLMKPYVVKEVDGPTGRRVYHPTLMAQVIRPETAAKLTQMLVSVIETVEDGQVRGARVAGYHLAGKTGTAEVPTESGYASDRTIASFIGFGPVESPRFVIMVTIREPKDTPWGETVAAPVFRNIASQLLPYFGAAPSVPEEVQAMESRR